MRPVSLTYTGTVGVSIQDVFDLIADPSRMAEWLPNCVSVVPGPTNRGKGDRHRLHFERQGRKADAVIEVIEYEPPTTYAWVEIIYRRGSKTFAQDVRRPAAESSESADSITEAADGRRGLPERLCRFVAKGGPVVHQSGNGTSIVIPSFATTVSLNTSRASFTNSSALIEYRAETWLRTSRRALAASAT